MHEHHCGPNCRTARFLANLTRKRARLDIPRIIPVKSWCRICGIPVFLEVLNDYEQAVRHFYALDDTSMNHKGVHAEKGGWGASWRLDDVLFTVFPQQHEEELWPMGLWWRGTYGEPLSEDQGILVMREGFPRQIQEILMDNELVYLEKFINKEPKSREELEEIYGEVWDPSEVGEYFEIYGFRTPFAVGRSKFTNRNGSLIFQNHPRFYFSWSADRLI